MSPKLSKIGQRRNILVNFSVVYWESYMKSIVQHVPVQNTISTRCMSTNGAKLFENIIWDKT